MTATYWFVGDGVEVLGCEAYEANARELKARLEREQGLENLTVYERNPSETTTDSAGNVVWAYPAERTVAARDYRLPPLDMADLHHPEWPTWDVFRSENRAGGTEQHVGTLKAEDEAAALEAAEATFACPVTHRLRVALAEG